MKRFTILTLVIILSLTTLSPAALAQGGGGNNGNGGNGRNGGGNGNGGNGGNGGGACSGILIGHFESLPVEDLSQDELDAIVFLREEEKLARDVYATLSLSWDLRVFSNIARSEQRHMDLVARLLVRYGVTDPVVDDTIGAFTNPEIDALYVSLVAAGETSLEQALLVGATIEDLDIADLNEIIAETDNLDIALIGYNMVAGSRNHLRAFSRALANGGFEPYSAQYLSQTEIDTIIASERETGVIYDEYGDVLATCGSGNGGGQGPGNGRECGRGQRDGSCPNVD